MSAAATHDTRAMPCPACGRGAVAPLPGSTLTVAWYSCTCGHFWSARVRDGRAVYGGDPAGDGAGWANGPTDGGAPLRVERR